MQPTDAYKRSFGDETKTMNRYRIEAEWQPWSMRRGQGPRLRWIEKIPQQLLRRSLQEGYSQLTVGDKAFSVRMEVLKAPVMNKLGLTLNAKLQCLMRSRIEYDGSDITVSFEISNTLGGFRVVPEDILAAHAGARNVGIFGTGDPVEASARC